MTKTQEQPGRPSLEFCNTFPPKADISRLLSDVRFSNRPVEVKRFQATHDGGVDVAHGLVLLYGIGA